MKLTRAVAGLLLLALVFGAQAGNRCANCGLGEGIDACNCGNTAVRAKKLSKPDFFASPEAIKNALKLKKAYGTSASSYAPASVYSASPAQAPTSLYSALPAPSPIKQIKDNKDLKNLLRLTSGISIAPKFEPIGDLCHSCKGYKNDVVGVVPARPGKLPCKCPKLDSEDKSTPTPSPLPAYSAPDSAYSVSASSYSAPASSYASASAAPYSVPTSSYSAPAPSYSVPATSYSSSAPAQNNPAPLYSGPTAPAQYAAAYQTAAASYLPPLAPVTVSALAQYASAYQQPSPVIYVAAPSSPTKRSYEESESRSDCNCKSKQNSVTVPIQYAVAYQKPAPVIYEAETSETTKRSYKKSNPQSDYEAPLAKRSYQNSKSEPQCNCKNKQTVTTIPVTYAAPAQYESEYQEQVPVNYVTAPSPSTKTPCDKCNAQSDPAKDEREAEAYVEIVLQEEQTPTADPVSISLAYKNLAESHGKKYVAEDSLAYGHYKEPADGRVSKRISNFDEEKLHTVDKPVVELKDCECRNGNCQNIQVSYSDIGFGPVAPSKNRFVPKTDDASNSSPYGQSIVYVPPPEDTDGLPYGPLGSTIPGYKSGGVIVNDDNSNAKSTCGCGGNTSTVKEGSRQAVLVEEEEYENDSYNGNGGIIERIKSSACKSGY